MKHSSSGWLIRGARPVCMPGLFVQARILKEFWLEAGQDLVEFALVIALISPGATASMSTVAMSISTAFSSVGTKFGGCFPSRPIVVLRTTVCQQR
jgi:Flp pilus assembly pilin Flp